MNPLQIMKEYKSKIDSLEKGLSENSNLKHSNHQYQQSVDNLSKTTLQLQAQIAEYHLQITSQNEVCIRFVNDIMEYL